MREANYKIHLMYWAIIFVILTIFIVLCVPGRINDEAFSNFSFASVLVSIVLAVISIVLSISVGQSTTHYNLEIKDVEKEIQDKLRKFDDLDDSIRSSVENVVKKEVDDVKRSQSETKKIIESLVDSTRMKGSSSVKNTGGTLDISNTNYLCVASLYLAAICYRTGKPLPISQLKYHSFMIVGFLSALSTIEPDNLLTQVKGSEIYVTSFASSRWGDEEDLKNAVTHIDKKEIKDVVLSASCL
jgi:hypothetical protein